jgi:hypothetical protein
MQRLDAQPDAGLLSEWHQIGHRVADHLAG